MAKRKSIIPGFSLNRVLGITSAKQKIARATGIPTTKQGRKRKLQSTLWTAVAFGASASRTQDGDPVSRPTARDFPDASHSSCEYNSTVKPQASRPKSLVYSDQGNMFAAAAYSIFEAGTATVSVLQRNLKIGYCQAAKLMDELHARGIVGEFSAGDPREILVSQEQFEESFGL